VPFAIA